MSSSTELARTIEGLTSYEHADTLRGEPNDFHAEAVSLEADAGIAVRARAGTLILERIALALSSAGGYVFWRVEGPSDPDYGNDVLVVRIQEGKE